MRQWLGARAPYLVQSGDASKPIYAAEQPEARIRSPRLLIAGVGQQTTGEKATTHDRARTGTAVRSPQTEAASHEAGHEDHQDDERQLDVAEEKERPRP